MASRTEYTSHTPSPLRGEYMAKVHIAFLKWFSSELCMAYMNPQCWPSRYMTYNDAAKLMIPRYATGCVRSVSSPYRPVSSGHTCRRLPTCSARPAAVRNRYTQKRMSSGSYIHVAHRRSGKRRRFLTLICHPAVSTHE